MQAYSSKRRETDPMALPDIEVFRVTHGPGGQGYIDGEWIIRDDAEPVEDGWYYWPCFPGCLPDGDAIGPFATRAEALEDAREGMDDEDDEEDEEDEEA